MTLWYLMENRQGHYNSDAHVAPVQEIIHLRKSKFDGWGNHSSLVKCTGYSSVTLV